MEPDQIEIRFDDMKKIILVLIFVFVVSGCGTTVNSSPSPTEISTSLSQPTVASSPTAIPSPSAVVPTSEPPLKTNGPYFTYFREVNGVYQLVMMDADGVGQKIVDLPQGFVDSLTNQQFGLDMKFVSPDGKRLAFYTGTSGKYGEMPAQGQSDLTLNLLNLETGEKHVVTPLLSKDYPNNFTEAAKALNDPYKTAESLYDAFTAGITQAIGWSPNGQYLAFAGQMDGLSSDLYVYDVNTQKIQRLSSGDQELQWIDWSPDGKWILHGSVYSVGEGMEYDIYAAAMNGSSIQQLPFGLVDNWLNSHKFFEYDSQNGSGNFGLRLVDLDTGKITKIWDGSFLGYKVNPNGNWLVIATLEKGLQIINLKTYVKAQAPDSLLNPPDSFLRLDDGEIFPLDLRPFNMDKNISTSPDAKYSVITIDQDIKVYSSNIDLIKDVSVPVQDTKLTDVQWNPDSSGLFLIYGTNIYSLNISNGDVNLVETNLIDNYGSAYKWINGQ